MPNNEMSREVNHGRRRFLGTAAMSLATAELAMIGRAAAEPGKILPAIKSGTNTSLGPLKQIAAGVLDVAYAEAGPSDGTPALLLHGWPYDIHTYVDVAPLLASAGYRVIVPFLRGYGRTRFLSDETSRNGQQAAVAPERANPPPRLTPGKREKDDQHANGGADPESVSGGVTEHPPDRYWGGNPALVDALIGVAAGNPVSTRLGNVSVSTA